MKAGVARLGLMGKMGALSGMLKLELPRADLHACSGSRRTLEAVLTQRSSRVHYKNETGLINTYITKQT